MRRKQWNRHDNPVSCLYIAAARIVAGDIPTQLTEAGILPPVAGGGGVAVVLEVYEALAIARWIP
jgi:hypothetical protein